MYLFIYISPYLPIYLPIYVTICLPIHLSISQAHPLYSLTSLHPFTHTHYQSFKNTSEYFASDHKWLAAPGLGELFWRFKIKAFAPLAAAGWLLAVGSCWLEAGRPVRRVCSLPSYTLITVLLFLFRSPTSKSRYILPALKKHSFFFSFFFSSFPYYCFFVSFILNPSSRKPDSFFFILFILLFN